MTRSIHQAILQTLDEAAIDYRHLTHEPTRTSAEAARVRGLSMRMGGKALLMKAGAGDRYVLVVLSAALRLNSNALRHELGVDRLRFATLDELRRLTGLVPGAVPPFGEPVLPFPLYLDQSILDNDRIAFNAGSLTDSIIMSVGDYRRVARIERIVNVGASG
jgi:prolyl-tRNA editing enzyme YbaK/EbsC (Cys-tRNA(Pro) deacylase)